MPWYLRFLFGRLVVYSIIPTLHHSITPPFHQRTGNLLIARPLPWKRRSPSEVSRSFTPSRNVIVRMIQQYSTQRRPALNHSRRLS